VPRHVYIHVPFCARRCSYCDFSIAVRRQTPVDEYLAALENELAHARSARVDTIYVGGGTPSRLGADGVRRLLNVVQSRYTPEADAEITLEANPDDITPEAAAVWLEAGVNRLSLGIQSFDDDVLRWMHRVHDAVNARSAYRTARSAGFTNVSLDLIFALPAALKRDWRRDLEHAIALAPEHVSLYGLTVEPTTPLARWRDRGAVLEAPEERYEAEFLLADELLTAAGFEHYEVSNFGLPGRHSHHNSAYWTLAPYAGHGPSAHGYDGVQRFWNEGAYVHWLQRLHAGSGAVAGTETLDPEQRELEGIYLGLRTAQGITVGADEHRLAEIERWTRSGWARLEGGRAVLTPTGWLRLDALATVLTRNGSLCNV
jgi:oxygen-independent coproporphyrinogen III oxidase